MHRPRILLTVGHYLPGFKSGGPLRSVLNLVGTLHTEFSFHILTSDRDLGDAAPYGDIKTGTWVKVGHASVRYLALHEWSLRHLCTIIRETEHDLLYLNSFFAKGPTIYPLLGRRLGWIPDRPVLLATRGEFARSAMSSKAVKKRLYKALACRAGLLDGISWHASSLFEATDIERQLGKKAQHTLVASDLSDPVPESLPIGQRDADPILNVLFLSRISPVKNLDYALRILSQVTEKLVFNIYGPIEDPAYWTKCQQLVAALPNHIEVACHGAVNPVNVRQVMRDNDLFFLPTKGENYGHVIAEALSVGTRVLISDQTPWRGLAGRGLGCDLPLDTPQAFIDQLNEFVTEKPEQRLQYRQTAHVKFRTESLQSRDTRDNVEMFRATIMANTRTKA